MSIVFITSRYKRRFSITLDLLNYVLINFAGLKDSDQLCCISLCLIILRLRALELVTNYGHLNYLCLQVHGISGDEVEIFTVESKYRIKPNLSPGRLFMPKNYRGIVS